MEVSTKGKSGSEVGSRTNLNPLCMGSDFFKHGV
jgi:hypothetical protein